MPYSPGVYIMRDITNKVIYVGKAKKLRNRVSQYFLDNASHSPKTRIMVSKIHHFDVIVASSEFEALVLECSLIKQHLPKYNILLKDDKGYPYIRLDTKSTYPSLSVANKITDDGAEYFGPFGNRGVTQGIIDAVLTTLMLPKCKKVFPRDIGKDRPCLNYHMNQCAGWCQSHKTQKEYAALIEQAKQLLNGNFKGVSKDIREQMLSAAEEMNFELAAILRDRLNAVESLGQKQLVTALSKADTDVVGYGQSGSKACISVLHFCNGSLLDKECEIFSLPEQPEAAVSSLLKQYYFDKRTAPKKILLPFSFEDRELLEAYLYEQSGKKTQTIVPQRGDNMRLVQMANKNALDEAERVSSIEEKHLASVKLLGRMLSIDPPKRIESFDISNISGTDIVASMVVFVDGKPQKSDYKRFKIRDLTDQDDYRSMEQVIERRFRRYLDGDNGFKVLPDLLLIDGGVTHADVARKALASLNICLPIFGMVKDDRHRTRTLVTPDGREIGIETQQTVFSLIGNIQEETHRFAISYHRKLRSDRLRYSELDKIPGIGAKRKQDLLKAFQSLTAIKAASLLELEHILPANAALAVYKHFHPETEESE